MPPTQSAPIRNRLLASLPQPGLAAMLPGLHLVPMPPRQSIYRPDAAIDAVYFPEAGMISLVANLDDGTQAEVGIIGREGMLGTSLLAGADTPFVEAIVQMPGNAWRMSIDDFRQELDANAPLRGLLLRYNETLQAQIMQTAACNGRHNLEERFARWLLMAHDRAEADELPLTQEFVAMMLGVHRPSVSITAAIMQRAGLIRYAGGRITVLDRAALQAASCECYGSVQRRYNSLFSPVST